MKDAFGRQINVGDIIVYATRISSSQFLNVAIVRDVVKKKTHFDTEREFLRADCFAGTSFAFTFGVYDKKVGEYVKITSRKVTLRATRNIMIVNGINVEELRPLASKM